MSLCAHAVSSQLDLKVHYVPTKGFQIKLAQSDRIPDGFIVVSRSRGAVVLSTVDLVGALGWADC